MADTKPLVVVFGATGAQGGAVARELLKNDRFAIRGVTRNVSSDRASALTKAGVEMVAADMSDKEAVQRAVTGAHAVFLLTQFWEKLDPELEREHGRNAIEACKTAEVQHVVFSSLPDPRPHLDKITNPAMTKLEDGSYVPHFESKSDLVEALLGTGLPCTFAQIGFYYENFINFFPPQPAGDGTYTITLPMGEDLLNGIAVSDYGVAVARIIDEGEPHFGKTYTMFTELQGAQEYITALGEAMDIKIAYQAVPNTTYAQFGFPGAEDLANMFCFFRHPEVCPYSRSENKEHLLAFNPSPKSFRDWLKEDGVVEAVRSKMP